jgi:hypothetical protein
MANGLAFQVHVAIRDNLSPMAVRARDLSPAFEKIIDAWTEGNLEKFEQAEGAERSGLSFDSVYWKAVTPQYYREKHGPIARGSRTLYDDWLMHRTGVLMESMEDKDSMQANATIGQNATSFGFPAAIDEPMKILGNWERRQVIFLSGNDTELIEQIVDDYINAVGEFTNLANTETSESDSPENGFDFGGES